MKITIDNYLLSTGGVDGPANFKLNGKRMSQEMFFLRGDEVRIANRNNRTTTITFDVVRQFQTIEEAEMFVLTHETDLPDQGLVLFAAGRASYRALRWLPNAMIDAVEGGYIGCSTHHSYVIIGGKMLLKDPNK